MTAEDIRSVVSAVLEEERRQRILAEGSGRLTDSDVRAIVAAVLEEESVRRGAQLDEVVMKAVATILTGFGIDEDDRKELTLDFIHLRKWRKSVDQAQSLTFKVVFTAIISGLVGAVWLGFKATLGK